MGLRKAFLHNTVLPLAEVHTDEQQETLGLQIFSLVSDSWFFAFTISAKNQSFTFKTSVAIYSWKRASQSEIFFTAYWLLLSKEPVGFLHPVSPKVFSMANQPPCQQWGKWQEQLKKNKHWRGKRRIIPLHNNSTPNIRHAGRKPLHGPKILLNPSEFKTWQLLV